MTSLDSDYPLTIDMLTDLFLLPYRSMITDLDSSNHIHARIKHDYKLRLCSRPVSMRCMESMPTPSLFF